MSVCQQEERQAGRAYPRTCPTCKLGPCQRGHWKGTQAPETPMTGPTREEVERLADRLEASQFHSRSQFVREAATMLRALRERAEAAEAEIERLTKERDALAAASWIAGRDAAADMFSHPEAKLLADRIRAITPPTDATAALQAVKDAEWDAALEAMRKGLMIENGSPGDHTIRALRRNPKEGV